MTDVLGSFYTGRKIRQGVSASSPSNETGVTPNPLNPPGSNPSFDSGIGIKLNGQVIGGVKRLIETGETLVIPIDWEYNVYHLDVDGVIENDGEINFN